MRSYTRSAASFFKRLSAMTIRSFMIYIMDHWITNHRQQTKYTIAVPNTRIADEIGVSIRTYYRAVGKLKTDHFISIAAGNICVTYEQIQQIRSYLQNAKAVTALPAFLENSTLV